MPSRRNAIELSTDEIREMLMHERVLQVASINPDGTPHLAPMWFVVDEDGSISFTTYGKSQKIMNLERDARITVVTDSGHEYNEIKGVSIDGTAEVSFGSVDCVAVLDGFDNLSGATNGFTGPLSSMMEENGANAASCGSSVVVVDSRSSGCQRSYSSFVVDDAFSTASFVLFVLSFAMVVIVLLSVCLLLRLCLSVYMRFLRSRVHWQYRRWYETGLETTLKPL